MRIHRGFLALTLLATTACATLAPTTIGRAAYIASAAADVATTRQAIDRGGTEAAPVASAICSEKPSTGCLTAMKAGGFFLFAGFESLMVKQTGRPLNWWESLVVWGGVIVGQTWVSYHNHGVAR